MLFLISALRAVVELLGMCLIGQGVLYLLAGAGRAGNPIYRLFDLLTRPLRQLMRALLPSSVSAGAVAGLTFILLFCLWVGLAWMRNFV